VTQREAVSGLDFETHCTEWQKVDPRVSLSDCSERTFCSKKGKRAEGCKEFDNGELQFHISPSIMLIKSRKVTRLSKREDKKKTEYVVGYVKERCHMHDNSVDKMIILKW